MINIQSITLREIRLALKEVFQISSGSETDRRIFLLQLKDADGIESWSECVAGSSPNYLPETIDVAWLAIKKWVAPRVLGRNFKNPEDVQPILEKGSLGIWPAVGAQIPREPFSII